MCVEVPPEDIHLGLGQTSDQLWTSVHRIWISDLCREQWTTSKQLLKNGTHPANLNYFRSKRQI